LVPESLQGPDDVTGAMVGAFVGDFDGAFVGDFDGAFVGDFDGAFVVGAFVSSTLFVGAAEGASYENDMEFCQYSQNISSSSDSLTS